MRMSKVAFWTEVLKLVAWAMAAASMIVFVTCFTGCGPSKRSNPKASVLVVVGNGDRPMLVRSLALYDSWGYGPVVARVEIRDPDPVASQVAGEPRVVINGTSARAWTFPNGSILIARGQERWLAHEAVHVQRGGSWDRLHLDPIWVQVNLACERL